MRGRSRTCWRRSGRKAGGLHLVGGAGQSASARRAGVEVQPGSWVAAVGFLGFGSAGGAELLRGGAADGRGTWRSSWSWQPRSSPLERLRRPWGLRPFSSQPSWAPALRQEPRPSGLQPSSVQRPSSGRQPWGLRPFSARPSSSGPPRPSPASPRPSGRPWPWRAPSSWRRWLSVAGLGAGADRHGLGPLGGGVFGHFDVLLEP